MSSSFKRVAVSYFTFFFFAFFFFYTSLFFIPCLLLLLNCSYIKKRLLKDQCHFYKYFKITLTFSSFITERDIYLTDTLVGVQIGVRQLTSVIFIVGAGDLIINILPVRRRFLVNIVGANKVDIFINYRAASADQFNSISKIMAVVEVEINFIKKSNCFTYKISQIA